MDLDHLGSRKMFSRVQRHSNGSQTFQLIFNFFLVIGVIVLLVLSNLFEVSQHGIMEFSAACALEIVTLLVSMVALWLPRWYRTIETSYQESKARYSHRIVSSQDTMRVDSRLMKHSNDRKQGWWQDSRTDFEYGRDEDGWDSEEKRGFRKGLKGKLNIDKKWFRGTRKFFSMIGSLFTHTSEDDRDETRHAVALQMEGKNCSDSIQDELYVDSRSMRQNMPKDLWLKDEGNAAPQKRAATLFAKRKKSVPDETSEGGLLVDEALGLAENRPDSSTYQRFSLRTDDGGVRTAMKGGSRRRGMKDNPQGGGFVNVKGDGGRVYDRSWGVGEEGHPQGQLPDATTGTILVEDDDDNSESPPTAAGTDVKLRFSTDQDSSSRPYGDEGDVKGIATASLRKNLSRRQASFTEDGSDLATAGSDPSKLEQLPRFLPNRKSGPLSRGCFTSKFFNASVEDSEDDEDDEDDEDLPYEEDELASKSATRNTSAKSGTGVGGASLVSSSYQLSNSFSAPSSNQRSGIFRANTASILPPIVTPEGKEVYLRGFSNSAKQKGPVLQASSFPREAESAINEEKLSLGSSWLLFRLGGLSELQVFDQSAARDLYNADRNGSKMYGLQSRSGIHALGTTDSLPPRTTAGGRRRLLSRGASSYLISDNARISNLSFMGKNDVLPHVENKRGRGRISSELGQQPASAFGEEDEMIAVEEKEEAYSSLMLPSKNTLLARYSSDVQLNRFIEVLHTPGGEAHALEWVDDRDSASQIPMDDNVVEDNEVGKMKRLQLIFYKFIENIVELLFQWMIGASTQLAGLLRAVAWCATWLWITSYLRRTALGGTGFFTWSTEDFPRSYYFLEGMFIWSVTIDYIIGLIVATRKIRYIFSVFSVIDLLTLPVFVSLLKLLPFSETAATSSWLVLIGYLRFLRLIKAESVLSQSLSWLSVVTMRVFSIIIKIITILLTFAGAMFILESPFLSDNQSIRYNTVYHFFYYALVTVSTVGYGDFAPRTMSGRTIAIIAIIVTFSYLPSEVQRLVEALNLPKVIQGTLPSSVEEYVCLIGPVMPDQLRAMCREIALTFPGSISKVVVISPLALKEYKTVVSIILRQGVIRICVYSSDMKHPYNSRIRKVLRSARAILIFSNPKNAGSSVSSGREVEFVEQEEDQATLLRFIGIRALCFPIVPISVQLIHDYRKGLVTSMGAYNTICLSEYKMLLMGKSCADCPGFLTLIGNWFYRPAVTSDVSHENADYNFLSYSRGACHQIYRFEFPTCFKGSKFSHVARFLYKRHNVFLIGIVSLSRDIWLNPHTYIIGEELALYTTWPFAGIVLAPSLDAVVKLTGLCLSPQLQSYSTMSHSANSKSAQDKIVRKDSRYRKEKAQALPIIREDSYDVMLSHFDKRKAAAARREHVDAEIPYIPDHEPSPEKVVKKFEHSQHASGIFQVDNFEEAKMVFSNPEAALILVCGWPRGIRQFLRVVNYSGEPNVIILAPGVPLGHTVNDLIPFRECCVYIQGSALRTADVVRAGLLEASSCAIFSLPHMHCSWSHDETKLDTQAVLVHQIVDALLMARSRNEALSYSPSSMSYGSSWLGEVSQEINLEKYSISNAVNAGPKKDKIPFVVTELREASFLNYFGQTFKSDVSASISGHDDFFSHYINSQGSYILSPSFFSGNVFLDEMLYSLMCYDLSVSRFAIDPSIIQFLIEGRRASRNFAVPRLNGKDSFNDTKGTTNSQAYKDELQHQQHTQEDSGKMKLEPVPANFIGSEFAILFEHLSKFERKFAVGIYRPMRDSGRSWLGEGFCSSQEIAESIARHIVVSCPAPSMRLMHGDQVYVLYATVDEHLDIFRPSQRQGI